MRRLTAVFASALFFLVSLIVSANASELSALGEYMIKTVDSVENITWIRDKQSHEYLSEKTGTLKIDLVQTSEGIKPYLVVGYIADNHIYTSKLIVNIDGSVVSLSIPPNVVRGGAYSRKSLAKSIAVGIMSGIQRGLDRGFAQLERRLDRKMGNEFDAYIYIQRPISYDSPDMYDYYFWESASVHPQTAEDTETLGALAKRLSNESAKITVRLKGIRGTHYDFALSKEQRSAIGRTWRYYELLSGRAGDGMSATEKYMEALGMTESKKVSTVSIFTTEDKSEAPAIEEVTKRSPDKQPIVDKPKEVGVKITTGEQEQFQREQRRILDLQRKMLEEQRKILEEQKRILEEIKKTNAKKTDSDRQSDIKNRERLIKKYIKEYWES